MATIPIEPVSIDDSRPAHSFAQLNMSIVDASRNDCLGFSNFSTALLTPVYRSFGSIPSPLLAGPNHALGHRQLTRVASYRYLLPYIRLVVKATRFLIGSRPRCRRQKPGSTDTSHQFHHSLRTNPPPESRDRPSHAPSTTESLLRRLVAETMSQNAKMKGRSMDSLKAMDFKRGLSYSPHLCDWRRQ